MIGKRILINQFVQKPILFERTRGKINQYCQTNIEKQQFCSVTVNRTISLNY